MATFIDNDSLDNLEVLADDLQEIEEAIVIGLAQVGETLPKGVRFTLKEAVTSVATAKRRMLYAFELLKEDLDKKETT